ncbi:MAG: metallophosphoesterase [Sedimenticola sp.]
MLEAIVLANKYIHISDMHVTGKGERVFGLDSDANFRRCIDHIGTYNRDACEIICSGDLSNDGSVESYQLVSDCLSALAMEKYILLGNHDNSSNALHCLEDIETELPGFVQYQRLTAQGLFVFLDSVKGNESSGFFCSDRSDWLQHTFDQAEVRGFPVYLFMHHNPFPVHVASSDAVGLENNAAFISLLRKYKHLIKYLYFGHCHQTISGEYEGIPFASLKGTSHQIYPDFSDDTRFSRLLKKSLQLSR